MRNYAMSTKNKHLQYLIPMLTCECQSPLWCEEYNSEVKQYIVKCNSCGALLTDSQYLVTYNTWRSKSRSLFGIFTIPRSKVLQFYALRGYMKCLCTNPAWNLIHHYHTHIGLYSIKCSSCMRSATKKQYYTAANALIDDEIKASRLAKIPSPVKPTNGVKFDTNKIRVSLLKHFGLAFMAVAELATTGAKKYSDNSWIHVPNGTSRYDDALFGHYLREVFETVDKETQLPHEVATAWNALARLQLLIEADKDWKARLLNRDMEDINVS